MIVAKGCKPIVELSGDLYDDLMQTLEALDVVGAGRCHLPADRVRLREHLSRHLTFGRWTRQGILKTCYPPRTIVSYVAERIEEARAC